MQSTQGRRLLGRGLHLLVHGYLPINYIGEDRMIISRNYALRLVRQGRATIEGTTEHPSIIGIRLCILTRHDIHRVDHCPEAGYGR